MNRWLQLGAAIALEVMATLSLRAMEGFAHPWWLVPVLLGYGGSFVALSMLLKKGLAVGVVYGIWAAAGVALTALLGTVVFGDALTWVVVLGIVLVIGGVLLVEIGAHRAQRSGSGTEAS